MKKRILTFALALTLLFCAASPAFAVITTESSETAVLSYTVASTFSVTIPVAVTVSDGETANGTVIGTGTLTVDGGLLLDYNTELNVTISGANYDAVGTDGYRLVDGTENYLKYAITTDEVPPVAITENGYTVLTVPAGMTQGDEVVLTYALAEEVTKSGTYTDTLTFTVSIDDIA